MNISLYPQPSTEERDQLRDLRLEELKNEIQKGINSGVAKPLNIEDIKARGRKRLAAQDSAYKLLISI